MNTTSPSLLARLRHPDSAAAWTRFVELYTPLLFEWARRLGLREHDAGDAVQDVLTSLLEKMRNFEYDREKSFRGWLRTVLKNQWRTVLKKRRPLLQADAANVLLADVPDPNEIELFDDTSHREYLVQRGLALIEGDFQETTWRAWTEFAVRGRPAVEVAAELGITAHAVYLAKARVLRRLREELDGLLED